MDLDFAYERKDLYSQGTHHVSSLILIVSTFLNIVSSE